MHGCTQQSTCKVPAIYHAYPACYPRGVGLVVPRANGNLLTWTRREFGGMEMGPYLGLADGGPPTEGGRTEKERAWARSAGAVSRLRRRVWAGPGRRRGGARGQGRALLLF